MAGSSPAKNPGVATLKRPPLIFFGDVWAFGFWVGAGKGVSCILAGIGLVFTLRFKVTWVHISVPWVRYLGYRALVFSRRAAMPALFKVGAAQLKQLPSRDVCHFSKGVNKGSIVLIKCPDHEIYNSKLGNV